MTNPKLPKPWTISTASPRSSSRVSRASLARRRTSSPCARTGSPRRPRRQGTTTARSCRCRGRSWPATRASATTRRWRSSRVSRRCSPPMARGRSRRRLVADQRRGVAVLLAREGALRASRSPASPRAPPWRRPRPVPDRADRGREDRRCARAGRTSADVDFVELNEAFASQSLACLAGWPELIPTAATCTAARWRSATRSGPPAARPSVTPRTAARRGSGVRRRRHLRRRRAGPRRRPRGGDPRPLAEDSRMPTLLRLEFKDICEVSRRKNRG